MNTENLITQQITMRSETPVSVARIIIYATEQLAPVFIPQNLLKDLSLANIDEIEMRVVIDRGGKV